MKKKRMLRAAAAACGIVVAGNSASASQSYIYNHGMKLPDIENTVLFASNHDNPNDTTSSGPLPTGLQGGQYNDGAGNTLEYYRYAMYEDGTPNYCTRFTSTERRFGQITFTSDDRATGTIALEFDAKFIGALNMQWLICGHNSAGSGVFFPLEEIDGGKLLKSANESFKGVSDNVWHHVKVTYNLDNATYTEEMTVNGETYVTVKDGEGLKNTNGFYMIRFQMRNSVSAGTAEAWLDNITITYMTEHSPKLHKDAVITAVDNPSAVVMRTGIKVNRTNPACTPIMQNNVIMYPLRFAADCYRAGIDYNAETGDVSVNYNGKSSVFNQNSSVALIDGEQVELGVRPAVRGGYTYVPLDMVARVFNKNAFVDDENYILLTNYENVTADKFEKLKKVVRGDMN